MTYQDVRGALETTTLNALNNEGVMLVFFDNVAHTQPSASNTYAEIAISFEVAKQDTVGCCGNNFIRGTISVYINTPANTGSSRGEELGMAIFEAWTKSDSVGLTNFDGPRTIAADEGAVHQMHTVSASFTAKSFATINGGSGTGGGSGGGSGGGGGSGTVTDVTTADVDLTNPTRSAWDSVDTTVITPPPANITTQEGANQYFVRVIDELDEALEDHKDYTDIDDLDELV